MASSDSKSVPIFRHAGNSDSTWPPPWAETPVYPEPRYVVDLLYNPGRYPHMHPPCKAPAPPHYWTREEVAHLKREREYIEEQISYYRMRGSRDAEIMGPDPDAAKEEKEEEEDEVAPPAETAFSLACQELRRWYRYEVLVPLNRAWRDFLDRLERWMNLFVKFLVMLAAGIFLMLLARGCYLSATRSVFNRVEPYVCNPYEPMTCLYAPGDTIWAVPQDGSLHR